jgi:hypothetical protein
VEIAQNSVNIDFVCDCHAVIVVRNKLQKLFMRSLFLHSLIICTAVSGRVIEHGNESLGLFYAISSYVVVE